MEFAKLACDAESTHERLEKLNRENKALYEELEPIVGTFCPGLAKAPLHIHRFSASRHC